MICRSGILARHWALHQAKARFQRSWEFAARRARQTEDFQPQLAIALKLDMAAPGEPAAGLPVQG
jgi:hypothetical protein